MSNTLTIKTAINFYLTVTMCGSRKYPYPPHGWSMEIPRGQGVNWAREKFPAGRNVGNHTTQTCGKYFELQRPKTLK